jgi:hypothetical protein
LTDGLPLYVQSDLVVDFIFNFFLSWTISQDIHTVSRLIPNYKDGFQNYRKLDNVFFLKFLVKLTRHFHDPVQWILILGTYCIKICPKLQDITRYKDPCQMNHTFLRSSLLNSQTWYILYQDLSEITRWNSTSVKIWESEHEKCKICWGPPRPYQNLILRARCSGAASGLICSLKFHEYDMNVVTQEITG